MYGETIQALIQACAWDTTNFLVVSENVFDPFIYYSHIVPLIVSLTIGFFILYKKPELLVTRILFSITSLFSLWVFFDLILWATDKPDYTIFFWSLLVLIEPLIYAGALYFIQVFITGQDTSVRNKILTGALLFPTIFLVHTKLALLGYNLANCDREAIEGPLTQLGYFIEIIYTLWIVVFAMEKYRLARQNPAVRRQIVLVTLGVLFFLLTLSSGNLIGTITNDWRLPQWGLFGMPVFIAFLSYIIVRYRAFDIRLVATQALAVMMSILIGSQFFFIKSAGNQVLNGITFLISIIGGVLLVRSVKKEIKQREEIEDLARRLKNVNSILSHDVKAVLGKNKDMFNALVEGDLGAVPDDAKPFLKQSFQDTQVLIESITTILEAGHELVLNPAPFDLKESIVRLAEEGKRDAEAKGLTLRTIIADGVYTINADKVQLETHVFHNLINNALNYTPKGSVEVYLSKDPDGTFQFRIKDTGIGINNEDKDVLFKEGGHGKDSRKVNIHSTGYGLFIAKKIIDAHGGKIWAESDGPGKGSTFFVSLMSMAPNQSVRVPKPTL